VKGTACRALFERISENQVGAMTSETVVAEIVYVLSSTRGAAYGLSRQDIVGRLRPLVSLKGLSMPVKPELLHALDLYQTHTFLDFADALTVAHASHQGLESITSYDHDFDRIDGVQRVEPGTGSRQEAA